MYIIKILLPLSNTILFYLRFYIKKTMFPFSINIDILDFVCINYFIKIFN